MLGHTETAWILKDCFVEIKFNYLFELPSTIAKKMKRRKKKERERASHRVTHILKKSI
jgi:hypothetical protein